MSSVCTWIQLMKASYPAVSLLTRCVVYQAHFCWTLVCCVRRKGCIYESRAGPASSHLAHCSYSASEFEDFVVTLSLHPAVRQCYKHKFHTITVNEGELLSDSAVAGIHKQSTYISEYNYIVFYSSGCTISMILNCTQQRAGTKSSQ